MTAVSRISLAIVLLVLGLGAGYTVASLQPDLYRSSATVRVLPPKVPDGVIGDLRVASGGTVAERLQSLTNDLLSRTQLEKLMDEFDLYASERRSTIMEDVVARMRERINIHPLHGDAFRITYTGSDPATVAKVTRRLAGFFIEESLKDKARTTGGILTLLEARIGETADRLAAAAIELERAGQGAQAMPKRLELEAIQTTYKNLLTRREDALGMLELEHRQIGEQFVLVDAAQVPQRPIGQPHLLVTAIGGAAGLTAAGLIELAAMIRRRLNRRRQDTATAT